MQLENTFVVPVPVDEAWRILLDIERVAPCMPGAELESVDGADFTGRVKVKVGPITITYRGKASFVSRDDDAREAVLEASGKETRGAGTAKATVRTKLVDRGSETEVQVVTDLAVTGKPAQFGRGVLAEVSGKLIDQFADCLADEVRGGGTATAAAGGAPTGGMPSSETSPEAAAGSVPTAAPVVGAEADGPPAADGAAPAAPAPAAPWLPPTGAPQEAAPAPAILLGAAVPGTGAPAAGAPPAASPSTGQRRVAEPINLLETAGAPVAKRVLPVVAALLVGYVLLRVIRRR